MLCFVVSVVEALNNRIYYEGMSNKCRTCVFSFNAIPDKRYEGTFEGKGTIGSSIKHV